MLPKQSSFCLNSKKVIEIQLNTLFSTVLQTWQRYNNTKAINIYDIIQIINNHSVNRQHVYITIIFAGYCISACSKYIPWSPKLSLPYVGSRIGRCVGTRCSRVLCCQRHWSKISISRKTKSEEYLEGMEKVG